MQKWVPWCPPIPNHTAPQRHPVPPHSFPAKGKSLVGRLLERPNTSEKSGKTGNSSGGMVIEREIVVSAHVKVGRGSSSVKVLKQHRVPDIHDKYILQQVFHG